MINLDDEIYLRPAWRSQWKSLAVIVVLILGHAVVTEPLVELVLPFIILFLIFRFLISHYSRIYMIGPKGIEVHIGLLSRDISRIELNHVRGVHTKQSILGRLMSIGNIIISTSSEGTDLVLRNIRHPVKYTEIISGRLKSL